MRSLSLPRPLPPRRSSASSLPAVLSAEIPPVTPRNVLSETRAHAATPRPDGRRSHGRARQENAPFPGPRPSARKTTIVRPTRSGAPPLSWAFDNARLYVPDNDGDGIPVYVTISVRNVATTASRASARRHRRPSGFPDQVLVQITCATVRHGRYRVSLSTGGLAIDTRNPATSAMETTRSLRARSEVATPDGGTGAACAATRSRVEGRWQGGPGRLWNRRLRGPTEGAFLRARSKRHGRLGSATSRPATRRSRVLGRSGRRGADDPPPPTGVRRFHSSRARILEGHRPRDPAEFDAIAK